MNQKVNNSKKEDIKCPFCNREFDDEEYMYRHISKAHITPGFRRRIRAVFRGH